MKGKNTKKYAIGIDARSSSGPRIDLVVPPSFVNALGKYVDQNTICFFIYTY